MSDNDIKFYFKMGLILAVAFFVWFFNSPENKQMAAQEDWQRDPARLHALANFVPPAIVVFKNSGDAYPERNWQAPFLELNAEAAIAAKPDLSRVYFNKDIEVRRPIASLTKLMTAIIVLENYNLDDTIKISRKAVEREGSRGELRPDEELTARSLLNIMLIDSSNDAATALSEKTPDFVDLMNKKAKELGLKNTRFANPDGLDGDGYSSALDVAKIFSYLINNFPQALEILKTRDMVVYSADGKVEHRIKNTNELLGRVSEVKAGKTGYTDNAGGSLALLLSGFDLNNENKIITVVLGSPDRFGESEKLIQWLKSAYIWSR